jgi:hypothetical protein
MTAAQIKLLDNMNVASQKAGGLGSRLDYLQYNGVASVPAAVGTMTAHVFQQYTYTTAPILGTATTVSAAIPLTASAQTAYAITKTLDVPRVVNVTGNASGITGNVVIHGTDFAGTVITNTIALSGTSTVAGTKAFASVTSVDFPAQTHSGTDTVSVGVSTTIVGLPSVLIASGNLLSATFNGSTDAGSVAVSTTLSQNLWTTAGTFTGLAATGALVLTFTA